MIWIVFGAFFLIAFTALVCDHAISFGKASLGDFFGMIGFSFFIGSVAIAVSVMILLRWQADVPISDHTWKIAPDTKVTRSGYFVNITVMRSETTSEVLTVNSLRTRTFFDNTKPPTLREIWTRENATPSWSGIPFQTGDAAVRYEITIPNPERTEK